MNTEYYTQLISPFELIYAKNDFVKDMFKQRMKKCCAFTRILTHDPEGKIYKDEYKTCEEPTFKIIHNIDFMELIPFCAQHAMFDTDHIYEHSIIYYHEELDVKLDKIFKLIDLIG